MDKGYAVAFSNQINAAEAIDDIYIQLGEIEPRFLMLYSDVENFAFYSEKLHQKYQEAVLIGATTYLALSSRGYSKTGLSVLAVADGIECSGGVIEDAVRFPDKYQDVIRECAGHFPNTDNCCCFELTTAFGDCEEIVQDTFRSVLEEKEIPVIGGTAGNTSDTKESYVSLNGEVYTGACVFAIVKNLNGAIRLYRENLYRPTDQFFDVTDVDCEERTVYEFDGKPAAKVMAKALGVTVEELPDYLPSHPLGRIVNGNIYITDHHAVTSDSALTYFARIYNHTMVVLLTPEDPQTVLSDTIGQIRKETESIRFMFVVNCLTRSRLFEQNGNLERFTDRLRDELGEYAGVSGYGEQMNFEHLNQTMLIAVFE